MNTITNFIASHNNASADCAIVYPSTILGLQYLDRFGELTLNRADAARFDCNRAFELIDLIRNTFNNLILDNLSVTILDN